MPHIQLKILRMILAKLLLPRQTLITRRLLKIILKFKLVKFKDSKAESRHGFC